MTDAPSVPLEKVVVVRFAAADLEHLEDVAGRRGRSAFVREATLQKLAGVLPEARPAGPVVWVQADDAGQREKAHQLNRIGSNLNQIARAWNTVRAATHTAIEVAERRGETADVATLVGILNEHAPSVDRCAELAREIAAELDEQGAFFAELQRRMPVARGDGRRVPPARFSYDARS